MNVTSAFPDDRGYIDVFVSDDDLRRWEEQGLADGAASRHDGLKNARGLADENSDAANVIGKITEHVVAFALGIKKKNRLVPKTRGHIRLKALSTSVDICWCHLGTFCVLSKAILCPTTKSIFWWQDAEHRFLESVGGVRSGRLWKHP